MPDTQTVSPLQTLVASVREKARTIVRAIAINRHVWKRVDLEILLKKVGSGSKELAKDIARTEYAISKLDPLNPDFAELKKDLDEDLADLREELVEVQKDEAETTASLSKQIEELNQKMMGIENGEILVSREHIDEQVNKLLERSQD